MIALGYLFSLLYGAFCILLGEITHKLGLSCTYSRKIVHIAVGFEWFILYHYMGTTFHFLIVSLAFLILLYMARRFGWFPGMSSDGENKNGTLYFGLSMSIMSGLLLIDPDFALPFGIAVVCTSLGDGAAGIFGEMAKERTIFYGKKTLLGTLSCFFASFCGIGLLFFCFDLLPPYAIIYSVALLAASVELISEKGTDNLFLPLSVCLFSYGLLNEPRTVLYCLFPILLTPWVIVAVRRKEALTKGGVIAALVLDAVMSLTLKNVGFFLLLLFLVLGVVSDAVKESAKARVCVEEEKSGPRDALQVLANGGALALFSVLYALTDEIAFLYAALASIAEALGDTAASGFGALSRKTFDLFRFRRCDAGQSGGMSVVGTLSGLLFCAVSLGFSRIFFRYSIKTFLLLLACAFLGTVFDSFLGSRCQRRYRCSVCGKITEKSSHCEKDANPDGGCRYVNNDVVNVLSALFAGAIALLIFII